MKILILKIFIVRGTISTYSKENGVLTRNGHTEAAVDLARLTGAQPAGVICEIMNDDGTMARVKISSHLKNATI